MFFVFYVHALPPVVLKINIQSTYLSLDELSYSLDKIRLRGYFILTVQAWVYPFIGRSYLHPRSRMKDNVKRVSLIIGTAGHIDHGKTSLIKALTSIDTDRLKEEKRRGLTIDLGFAYIDFTDKERTYRAAIVDVPGHERFIKNMLAGATGMDLVLFTVAADDGIMPQTIEHLEIIRLLGIEKVFFIITKCDLVDKKAIDAVEEEIKGLLKDTTLQGAPVFRVSVYSGEGLDSLRQALANTILSGRGLEKKRGVKSYFRLPVDRSFTVKGFGTVITGTVAGGALKKGDTLIQYPSGSKLKVRGLQSMHLTVREVFTGERAAINVSGLERSGIKRGACLMAEELAPFLTMAPVVDCLFEFMERRETAKNTARIIKGSSLIKVHHHTGEALARIRFVNKKSARSGERLIGRLFLKRPLPMISGDRFILRAPSVNTTVGGGRVILSYPSKGLVPRFNRLVACLGAGEGEPGQYSQCPGRALAMLLGPSRPGLDLRSVALLLNVRGDYIKEYLHSMGLLNDRTFYIREGWLLSYHEAHVVKEAMKGLLARYHEAHPLEDGLTLEDLAAKYGATRKDRSEEGLRPLYRLVAEELARSADVELKGARLSIKGHSTGPDESESLIEKKIKGLLKTRGLSLTKKEELTPLAPTVKEIDALIPYMKKKGSLIGLKQGLFIGAEAIQKAREACLAHISSKGGITAGQCRDILGCGRKLAILILEYFDNQGLTIRKGDIRTLR